MDRAGVERWIAGYERAWRTPGTERLGELFTADVSYGASPWATAVIGLDAVAQFWESERGGADEVFELRSAVVAVEADTAVVRAEVDYGSGSQWRDLWVLEFVADGRCRAFEEWPFAPDQRDGH